MFPREIEQQFATTYDKLLRATEAIEYARDLLAAVRDYQQARISIDQNEVMKRLTAIASILLVPTFIVGLYGQNFIHMPELHWRYGYCVVVGRDPRRRRSCRSSTSAGSAGSSPSEDVPGGQADKGDGDQRERDVTGVVEDPDRDLTCEVGEDADRDRP